MQDDTALYGAKMMQPVMTPADNEENNLRPQHLEDYIGQERAKQNLKIYLEAAGSHSALRPAGSGQDHAGGHHCQRDGGADPHYQRPGY